MTKLLPCPFCGGEAHLGLYYRGRYAAGCDMCGSRFGALLGTEAEAIAAWNSRAERTCKNVWDVELTGRLRFQCSECGAVSLEITPRFCPNCGKKVADQ